MEDKNLEFRLLSDPLSGKQSSQGLPSPRKRMDLRVAFRVRCFPFGISTLQGRAFFAKEVVPNKHLGQYQDIPYLAS